MTFYKNDEFFKVGNSKTVTVTLRFDVDEKSGNTVILRNAAEVAQFFADNRQHKSWTRSIKIEG